MKLKSLLMGSAAALITVSVAQAADAVVAEPEPVDYVKVCDMYGAGFFYIPGTERCLKISGEFRIQYEATTTDDGVDETSSASPYWHARVNFDAREETDWGTLRTYIRMENQHQDSTSAIDSDNENAEFDVGVLDAYIELGGFSIGRRTSRVELTGLPGLMHDGSYFGGGRTMYMDYTFAANGLSVMGGVSIDNDNIPSSDEEESIDGYIRADYAGSMFNIGASYGHDTSAEEGAWGIYANVTPVDGLLVQGYYNSQADSTQFGGGGGDTQKYGLGASFNVTDEVLIAAGYFHNDVDGAELDGYSLGLNWNLASNLIVRLGYNFEESDASEVSDYRLRIQSNF